MSTLREMLQEIIDMKAPYSRDTIEMAMNGFKQHSKYAQAIKTYLETQKINLDVEMEC